MTALLHPLNLKPSGKRSEKITKNMSFLETPCIKCLLLLPG